jgi:hypothetical protein
VLTASGLKDGELSEVESAGSVPDDAPTRLDLEKASQTPIETEAEWVLRYRVPGGAIKQVRGRTRDIRRWIEEGLLPQHTLAARDGQKRFRRVRDYPEFRPVAENDTPPNPPAPARKLTPPRNPVPRSRVGAEVRQTTVTQIGLLCLAGFVSVTISAIVLYCLFVRS